MPFCSILQSGISSESLQTNCRARIGGGWGNFDMRSEFSKSIMRFRLRFLGDRMNADVPERFTSAVPLNKSPLLNATQLMAECPNVLSCSLHSKVYLMRRAHRTGNIRFGLMRMCRSAPTLTSRKKSKLKSNGSRLVFAIALLDAIKSAQPALKKSIRIWPAATSVAALQMFGN